MKELDVLMKALEEKRVLKALRMSFANSEEKKPEVIKDCLKISFERDDELAELFADYCVELGFKTLIDKIDLEPKKSDIDDIKKVIEAIAELLA